MSNSVRNTLILACIFAVIIVAFNRFASGKNDDQTASTMRVDVWNCQDDHSHTNYKVLVKSNNGGADNVMLRSETGDIRCSK